MRLLVVGICALVVWCGCQANSGTERVGTAENDLAAMAVTKLNALRDSNLEALSQVKAELSALKANIGDVHASLSSASDSSHRTAETSQHALVASTTVDNSTGDRWLNRGLVILAGIMSYVIGKSLWILVGKVTGSYPSRSRMPPPIVR